MVTMVNFRKKKKKKYARQMGETYKGMKEIQSLGKCKTY